MYNNICTHNLDDHNENGHGLTHFLKK